MSRLELKISSISMEVFLFLILVWFDDDASCSSFPLLARLILSAVSCRVGPKQPSCFRRRLILLVSYISTIFGNIWCLATPRLSILWQTNSPFTFILGPYWPSLWRVHNLGVFSACYAPGCLGTDLLFAASLVISQIDCWSHSVHVL